MTRPTLHMTNAIWQDDQRLFVYCESSYRAILAELESIGYMAALSMEGDVDAESGKSPYVYVAPNVTRVKCRSCGALSSSNGSECHGKQCSGCEKVIFRDIYPGSIIGFNFEELRVNGPYAWLTVVRWDEAEGYLYCERSLPRGLTSTQWRVAVALLGWHSDKWNFVDGEDGQVLRKLQLPVSRSSGLYNLSIESEPEVGYDDVLYWNDVEYPADSTDSALPQHLTIYKRW